MRFSISRVVFYRQMVIYEAETFMTFSNNLANCSNGLFLFAFPNTSTLNFMGKNLVLIRPRRGLQHCSIEEIQQKLMPKIQFKNHRIRSQKLSFDIPISVEVICAIALSG